MQPPAIAGSVERRPSHDSRVILHGVSWEDYERILEIRGESSGVRIAYLKGELELMSPSKDHELYKKTIARLLECWAEETGVDLNGYGSWTLKERKEESGAEPDECYVVGVRDTHGNAVPGVVVAWSAAAGTISAAFDTTDNAGLASTRHTLAATAGPQTVSASVAGLPSVTFTALAVRQATLVATVPVPSNYGLHDTFVRDGIAFLCAWNTGVMIYDVGNGIRGGSPAAPRHVSTIATSGGQAHNAWWFHNPTNGQKRYLFVGEEGPGSIGSSSSGDIHVVDVTDLANPVEVGSYGMGGAGTHNFWMDEQAQVLFAAYYNGGVVALDVSGTLSGNLASREIARVAPGGAGNTYTWGVMRSDSSLYAVDMLSGFWQLSFDGSTLAVAGGGNNVPERFGSDLWVHGGYAYQQAEITRSLSSAVVAGNRLGQVPEHSFSLWNRYDVSKLWGVGLGIISQSDRFVATDNTVVLPSFTRVDAATIRYRFTVSDPSTWTSSWTAELPMVATRGPIFEHACHEGNYGLYNSLSAARVEEKKAAEQAKKKQEITEDKEIRK